MFAGVVPIKLSMQELKHETELLSKNFWFHCHVVTIVYASATVLRTVCKRKASEHVVERPTKISTAADTSSLCRFLRDFFYFTILLR